MFNASRTRALFYCDQMNYFDANIKAADQKQSTIHVNWRSGVAFRTHVSTMVCFLWQNLTEVFSINLSATKNAQWNNASTIVTNVLSLVVPVISMNNIIKASVWIKCWKGKLYLSILILWNRWTREIWSFSQCRPLPDFSWRKRPSRRLRNWTPLFEGKRPSENRIWSDR